MPLLVAANPSVGEDFPTAVATQAWLGESGIILGGVDDQGCTWKYNPTNAWGPKPAPREQTGDRTYDHGQWDATKFYGPRSIPITGSCRAPSHAALHLAEQRLRDAVSVAPFAYRVVEPGFDGYAIMRQQGEVQWTEDGSPATPHATYSISLYARSPLILSSYERTFDLAFPTTVGGRTRPRTLPGMIDADVVTGSRILSNPSAYPVGLELLIGGPANTVTIAYPDSGRALYLDNPDGQLLDDGQWLTVNTATRQVLLMGDAGRRSWAYGDWLQLPPGDTKLAIAGTGTTPASSVSGAFRAVRI